MKYSYDGYKEALLSFPLVILIFCFIIIIIFIVESIKKFKTWNIIDYIKCIVGYAIIIFFIWYSISELKYGFPLLYENESHTLITKGQIENIIIFENAPRMNGDDSCLITISGNDYFIMTPRGLQIGDYVEITYLPESTIILEVNIIYPEDEISD